MDGTYAKFLSKVPASKQIVIVDRSIRATVRSGPKHLPDLAYAETDAPADALQCVMKPVLTDTITNVVCIWPEE